MADVKNNIEKSPEEIQKELRAQYRKMFSDKNVEGVEPWFVGTTKYDKYIMRYPSWTETISPDLRAATLSEADVKNDSNLAETRMDALIRLTKMCVTNLKEPSDFDKAPAYVNRLAVQWVVERLGN